MHVVLLSVSSSNILISSAVQGTHLHQLTHHLHVVCSRGLLCGKRNRLEKLLRDRKLMLTLEYKFSVTVVILSVHAQAHVAYRYLVCFTAV